MSVSPCNAYIRVSRSGGLWRRLARKRRGPFPDRRRAWPPAPALRMLTWPFLVITLLVLGRGWYLDLSHGGVWRPTWARRWRLTLSASTALALLLWGLRFSGVLGWGRGHSESQILELVNTQAGLPEYASQGADRNFSMMWHDCYTHNLGRWTLRI